MPQYKCTKCKATCISKNPWTRSVFLDNKFLASMGSTTIVKTKPFKPGSDMLCFNIELGIFPMEMASPERIASTLHQEIKNLASLSESELKEFLCTHDWEITPGTGEELS